MLEQFVQEIRRREVNAPDLSRCGIGILAHWALCAEPHDEWSTRCRYLNMDEYFRWRADRSVEDSFEEEASLNGKKLLNQSLYLSKLKIWRNASYNFGS